MPDPRALLFAVLLPFGCQAVAPDTDVHRAWRQRTLLETGTKLGGCAVGDLDLDRPGNEIAVVAGDGRVLLLFHEPGAPGPDGAGWQHETIAQLDGEQIQCVIGDCRPDVPGNELITVGALHGAEDGSAPGAYHVFARVRGAWTEVEAGQLPALVHAVAVGDFDPQVPGNELLLAGFFGEAQISAVQPSGAGWQRVPLHGRGALELPGNAKGACARGGEAILACDDGSLVSFAKSATGFVRRELGSWPGAALARVAADPDGVLVCANDGALRYRQVRGNGAFSSTSVAVRAADRLRGAVLADLDPGHAGVEMATAGYDGQVYLVHVTEDEPDAHGLRRFATSAVPIARDDDRLHHLAAGDLPDCGPALVAVGYSGRVLVVDRR